jgi:hypothetical protein
MALAYCQDSYFKEIKMHRFNKLFFSSQAIYQELGLLRTLPPEPKKLQFVPPKKKEMFIDDLGVAHIDTWIAPVAGKMQMVTLT